MSAYSDEKLSRIYDRSSGYCHICLGKVYFKNYARPAGRGAWEVEHSKPKSKGGTDHLNNLYPACIVCNRDKSNRTTKTARAGNGVLRAPLTREARKQAKVKRAVGGGLLLGSACALIGGPVGAIIGAVYGAHVGHRGNPDRP